MSHTKLPWKSHHLYPDCLVTEDDPITSILTVDEDGTAKFLNVDDCKFAVKAANSHYDLVSTLQLIERGITGNMIRSSPIIDTSGPNAESLEMKSLLEIVRAALDKVI